MPPLAPPIPSQITAHTQSEDMTEKAEESWFSCRTKPTSDFENISKSHIPFRKISFELSARGVDIGAERSANGRVDTGCGQDIHKGVLPFDRAFLITRSDHIIDRDQVDMTEHAG